jgi:hypothetical protein
MGLFHQYVGDTPSHVVRVRDHAPDTAYHPISHYGAGRNIHDPHKAQEVPILDGAKPFVSLPDTKVSLPTPPVVEWTVAGVKEQVQHPVLVLKLCVRDHIHLRVLPFYVYALLASC